MYNKIARDNEESAQNQISGNTNEKSRESYADTDASGFLSKKEDSGRLMQSKSQQNLAGKQETDESKKHVYFGYMKLVVASLLEARNAISKIAETSGGYIEASYDTQVIIRIPKDKFNEVFASILGLGDVEKKTVETYDVTEYFQDLEMRLSVAEKTRARLYSLLERTQDVEERLKILREIKRLSEEIENLKLQLDTIRRLIAFSSITIDLIQRLSGTQGDDKNAIPFRWIASLDPFYPSIRALDMGIKLSLGDDFAIFDNSRYFYAESPEGVRVRAGTVLNRPSGDTDFWRKALRHYLAKYYKTAEDADIGDSIKSILFSSRDTKPYSYLIGISVKGDKIFVIEVFYPDAGSLEAKRASIEKSIREMKFL